MTAPDRDPFASSESAPAMSFKDVPDKTVFRMIADGPSKMLQQRVFGSDGELAFWPGKNGQPGNPKMAAVVNGTAKGRVGVSVNAGGIVEDGEPISLWAAIPGDLCSKVNDAQKAVKPGYRIKAGDEIAVMIDHREPSGKGNPKSVYAVKITPGEPAAASSDPFGGNGGDPWSNGPAATPAATQPAFSDEPPF